MHSLMLTPSFVPRACSVLVLLYHEFEVVHAVLGEEMDTILISSLLLLQVVPSNMAWRLK